MIDYRKRTTVSVPVTRVSYDHPRRAPQTPARELVRNENGTVVLQKGQSVVLGRVR